MAEVFHPLFTDIELPAQLNNPFYYEPHPLCKIAASEVCAYLADSPLKAEVDEGKMLGVLVCLRQSDKGGVFSSEVSGQLGYIAAYSGQLGGREDWPWFVPPVFDYLQPDGLFKRKEAEISDLNKRIALLEASPEMVALSSELSELRNQAEQEIYAYKRLMTEAKARRDASRGLVDEEVLIAESQFQKAELRRLKQRWKQRLAQTEEQLLPLQQAIDAMKEERRLRSDALQRWLFDQFVMQNVYGERCTLTEIFAQTPQRVPPAGAGECCAPKLLQYAFMHELRPLCMAEFWQGRSPKMEVRHHGQYYPACRGKCKPILEWMLQSSSNILAPSFNIHLQPIYEDSSFLIIDKPAGLLSVLGKTDEPSVESLLRKQYNEIFMVHRLDQDTSGLMVVALTYEAYKNLQQQFLARTIYKKYIALVDGVVYGSGTISLPLRPDIFDRPRQMADAEHGKAAVTDYAVLAEEDGYTRVALTPHTGRTHQLRMHCAHVEGLGAPIVGDRLYGKPAQRLYLHAAELAFNHPLTGERLQFTSAVPF